MPFFAPQIDSPALDAALAKRNINPSPASSFTPTPNALRTAADLSVLAASTSITAFAPIAGLPASQIVVDPSETFQQMYGAGAALTESTCYMLSVNCTPAQRKTLLTQAFGTDGFSTSRIQMGASDFTWRGTSGYYTYCDDWDGVDTTMPTFTILKDLEYIVPMLREALSVNPRLKFIASPWSPPAKMKSINSLLGTVGAVNLFVGNVLNYTAYANYFVKFLQAYKALGIPVWAVTVQNEPHYGPNTYPGCVWTGVQMDIFIGTYLGPALAAAGFGSVRILTGDMNWKQTAGYPGASGDLVLNTLTDTLAAAGYCAGSAWHGYNTAGLHEFEDQRAKNPYPGKDVHVTEMCSVWTGGTPNTPAIDFRQHLANCIIGGIRAGANSVTFWNLFLDINGKPFAPNYATVRPAAYLSTDGNATMTRTASYMALLHLLKVMKPGAKRCRSTTFGVGESDLDVQTVAFANPDGSVGVLLYNNATTSRTVSIVDAPSGFASFLTLAAGDVVSVTYSVPAGSVATGAVTPPGPIPTLSASGANGAATLIWGAATATDAAGISGYLIRRSATSGTETLTVGAAGPNATSFTDVDVVIGSTYYYQVFAISAGGLSASAPEASATVTANKPGAPVLTVAGGNAQNIISLTQSAPANGSAITSYSLYRSTTAGGEGATPYQTNVTFPYTDTGLTNGTAYYYTATATNGIGEGTQSAEVTAVPAVPVKPGKGLLVSNDPGASVGGTSNTTPSAGWSNSTYTFSPATSVASNHNTVVGPDTTTSDASTITFTNTGSTSGYASVECASSAVPGTGTLTGVIWLRGKVGGETLQLIIEDALHQNGNVATPTQIVLTTAWKSYQVQAALTTGATKLVMGI